MPSICHKPIQGTVMRLTRLDECGDPVEGACSTAVSTGFVSVAMTDNVESPDEFKVKNAGGSFCLNERSRPLLNWIETVVTFCEVDPELFEIASASPLVLDDAATPNAVGFGTDEDTYASANFALEVWTRLGGSDACAGGVTRYGYLLLPWLKEGTIGDLTIENGPLSFSVATITKGGNGWGVGPYDVVEDSGGLPSPLLAAIPTDRHRHWQITSLAPPTAECGCSELVLPS